MKWRTLPFGSICNLVNGKAFKPSDWSSSGVRIVRIQNLNGREKPFNHWAGSLDGQVPIRNGDLLLAWSGTPGTSFGAHIWVGGDAILNQHIFRCDLDPDIVTPEWAKFVVNQRLDRLIAQAHGGVGLKHVTRGMVERLQIPLPALPEQRRIAAMLDKADELRAKRRAALEQLSGLTQSVFLEMFGDPATNPKAWPVVPISDLLASACYGTSEKAGGLGAFPILRMGNISATGDIDASDLKFIDLRDADKEKFTVRVGDVLFNRTNSPDLVGKSAMVRTPTLMAFAGYLIRLRVNDRNNPEYLSAFLNSAYAKRVLRSMCKAIVGMANINATEIQRMMIPKPPVALQNEFALVVARVERLKGTFQTCSRLDDDLFNSVQKQAFSGAL